MTPKFNQWEVEGVTDRTKVLWAEGLSCSRICEALFNEFGVLFSRNAVIGKVTRLGLPPHIQTSLSNGQRLNRPRGRKTTKEVSVISGLLRQHDNLRRRRQSDSFVYSMDPNEIPLTQRKQLLGLKEDDCRFPYGDVGTKDFFFCGALTEEGKPYCSFHCGVCFDGFRRERKAA